MSNSVKKADKNTIEIMLLMTENCNLSCRYCYECNKSKRSMSYETAKKIIDNEIEEVKNTDKKLVIQFFGGEPTLNFDTIKSIYEYIKSLNCPNFDYCFTVTNGTVIDEEMKQWMIEHKDDFICGLSLDGTKEIHDFNRSNSYDLIDFNFFKETWPTQKVKMTISPDMLHKLSEGVIHCHNLGFGVLCNLADGIGWGEESSDILKIELQKLIEYYLENPNIKVCSILEMPLLHVDVKERTCFPKWCGAGDHIHAYDTEGNKFACQLFMNISGNASKQPQISKLYSADILPKKCQNCVLFGCCPTCMGANASRNCSPFYHTDVECKNIKIQFLATSYLMYEKYKRGQLELTEEEEYILLNGIYKVQEAFADL